MNFKQPSVWPMNVKWKVLNCECGCEQGLRLNFDFYFHLNAAFAGHRQLKIINQCIYGGADKSLARPTSRCILFDGENISFDASLVIYKNSNNISPIMIINRIYENQNLLSL